MQLQAYHAESPYLPQVLALFASIWHRDLDSTQRYFVDFAMSQPDFLGLIALEQEEVVAFGFGTRSLPGQWWHDRVSAKLASQYKVFEDAFVITEVGVATPYRQQGIGCALVTELMQQQPCQHILLSTQYSNRPAQQLYQKLGFCFLHRYFVFRAGEPAFVIMHKTHD